MRPKFIYALLIFVLLTSTVAAQKTLVIYDPTVVLDDGLPMLPDDEQAVFDSTVLPKLKAKYQSEGCAVDPELAGEVSGRFTKRGIVQKAAFYQICQTGNGLGIVAIVIFEDGQLVGVWGDNSGWSMEINAIPDMNANGIDEFTLSFGGGMHQGQGGVGVDIVEFQNGKPQVHGWFQAEKLMDTETESAWKVSVKTGKSPIFYRQKYIANSRGKLVRSGANSVFKLTKIENGFELLK